MRIISALMSTSDTFSFRQPNWARPLKIVEIDHPATQSAKLEALERAQIQIPENVLLVPLDLEKEDLGPSFTKTALNPSIPTFVACLGVLAYLRPNTVHRVFQSAAKMAQGSRFVFAFASDQVDSPQRTLNVATRTAELGEPWFTRFEVEDLKAELLAAGFRAVTFLDPAEAAKRYYKGRHDLPAPRKTQLCQAIV